MVEIQELLRDSEGCVGNEEAEQERGASVIQEKYRTVVEASDESGTPTVEEGDGNTLPAPSLSSIPASEHQNNNVEGGKETTLDENDGEDENYFSSKELGNNVRFVGPRLKGRSCLVLRGLDGIECRAPAGFG